MTDDGYLRWLDVAIRHEARSLAGQASQLAATLARVAHVAGKYEPGDDYLGLSSLGEVQGAGGMIDVSCAKLTELRDMREHYLKEREHQQRLVDDPDYRAEQETEQRERAEDERKRQERIEKMCNHQVSVDGRGVGFRQCVKPGNRKLYGKWFCKRHADALDGKSKREVEAACYERPEHLNLRSRP